MLSSQPKTYLQDGGDAVEVEIEDGEAVIGPTNGVSLFGGAEANTSSSRGFMAEGAEHGEINQGGTEGIPLASDESVYVASDKITANGFPAGKRYGKSQAQEVKPYLKYFEKAEMFPNDKYLNEQNTLAILDDELVRMEQEHNEGRFMKGLHDLLKRKDRNFQSVMDYIVKENPNDAEELLGGQGAVAQSLDLSPAQGMNPTMDPNMNMDLMQPQQELPVEQQMMANGGRNFSSNANYKKWLAYGHASGEFARTPGNQAVSIKGQPKRVQHQMGGYIDPSTMNNQQRHMYNMNRGTMQNGGDTNTFNNLSPEQLEAEILKQKQLEEAQYKNGRKFYLNTNPTDVYDEEGNEYTPATRDLNMALRKHLRDLENSNSYKLVNGGRAGVGYPDFPFHKSIWINNSYRPTFQQGDRTRGQIGQRELDLAEQTNYTSGQQLANSAMANQAAQQRMSNLMANYRQNNMGIPADASLYDSYQEGEIPYYNSEGRRNVNPNQPSLTDNGITYDIETHIDQFDIPASEQVQTNPNVQLQGSDTKGGRTTVQGVDLGKSSASGLPIAFHERMQVLYPGEFKDTTGGFATQDAKYPNTIFTDTQVDKLLNLGYSMNDINNTNWSNIDKSRIYQDVYSDTIGEKTKAAGKKYHGYEKMEDNPLGAETAGSDVNRMRLNNYSNPTDLALAMTKMAFDTNGKLPHDKFGGEGASEINDFITQHGITKDMSDDEIKTKFNRYFLGNPEAQGFNKFFNEFTRQGVKKENIGKSNVYVVDPSEQSGQVEPENQDLGKVPGGKGMSFSEAFAYARKNNLPEFPYNGKKYLAKTTSETTEEERARLAQGTKVKYDQATPNTSKSQQHTVTNPSLNIRKAGTDETSSYQGRTKQEDGGRAKRLANGQFLVLEKGGRVHQGFVANYDEATGDFDLI